jgi:mRNA-degrading endonuclease toxin of MazEF toxin-antitoxin module
MSTTAHPGIAPVFTLFRAPKGARRQSPVRPAAPSRPAGAHAPATPINRVPARGEIWFISSRSSTPDLGAHRSVGREIWSNKPAVVLSSDAMNTRSGVVQIVYLTTSENKRPSRLHVAVDLPLDDEAGRAIALCEQVHSVDQSRLTEFRSVVDPDQLREIEDAVLRTLGIEFDQAM